MTRLPIYPHSMHKTSKPKTTWVTPRCFSIRCVYANRHYLFERELFIAWLTAFMVLLPACQRAGTASVPIEKHAQQSAVPLDPGDESVVLSLTKYAGRFGDTGVVVALWSNGLLVWGDRSAGGASNQTDYYYALIDQESLVRIADDVSRLALHDHNHAILPQSQGSRFHHLQIRANDGRISRFNWDGSMSAIEYYESETGRTGFLQSWLEAIESANEIRAGVGTPLNPEAQVAELFRRTFPGFLPE